MVSCGVSNAEWEIQNDSSLAFAFGSDSEELAAHIFSAARATARAYKPSIYRLRWKAKVNAPTLFVDQVFSDTVSRGNRSTLPV